MEEYAREEKAKQYAYLNACDCLKYGYSRKYWVSCGVKGKEADRIWQQAKYDLANDN